MSEQGIDGGRKSVRRNMRVISGRYRGKKLTAPEGEVFRPTLDRVKETLFNILQFRIMNAKVLDLFAGSGQMGIEALSRGAASCVFVDNSPAAAEVIKQNLSHTRLGGRARVACCDWSAGVRSGTYDIVFVDPPYAAGITDGLLGSVAERMSEGGIIICESDARDEVPEKAGEFVRVTSRRYSRTVITVYRRIAEAGV